MDLQHIPPSNLKIATVNVRHGRKSPDVSDILPSIRARGVLQPLLVRPNGEGFGIIAGRRRYFAPARSLRERARHGRGRFSAPPWPSPTHWRRPHPYRRLNGKGRDKAEGWVPRYMAFPPQTYDPAKTLHAAESWTAIKHLSTGG